MTTTRSCAGDRRHDGLVRLRVGGAENVHHGHHYTDVDWRQPVGDRVRRPTPPAPGDHQLLRRVASIRRHAGGHRGDDFQRQQADQRQVDIRVLHVRRVELERCVLLHRVHTAPVLHKRGPVLRHRQPAAVPDHHDAAHRSVHAAQRVDATGAHIVPSAILRLVHDRRASGVPPQEPHVVRFRRQPVLRDHIVVCLVLDTRRRHDRHVLQVLTRLLLLLL